MLNRSSYYNPINPGLLKFLADKSGDVFLINSVKNYVKEFSCKDLNFLRNITIIGNNISSRESTLIVNTLLENKITIGQLCNLCSPKIPNYNIYHYNAVDYTLILDATESLLEFYYSVKVCSCNVFHIVIYIDGKTKGLYRREENFGGKKLWRI